MRRKNWHNFAHLFILIPLLFGVFAAFLGVKASSFMAAIIPNRGNDIVPSRDGATDNLPEGDVLTDLLPDVLNLLLSLVAIALVILLIYAGYLHVTAFGNEEKTGKANHLLYWAILGIFFIVFAYALVYGITHITWNRTG